jgi:hypothetical protein
VSGDERLGVEANSNGGGDQMVMVNCVN